MTPSRNFLPRKFALLAVAWTFLLSASLFWNLGRDEGRIWETAYAEARANLNKDISFRRWATKHGGVYVPITDTQKSVPFLDHVGGRDVITTSGQELTLLNPATMLRQLMDSHARDYGARGRITGLKWLNPANAPDDWERTQLEAFTRGERKEVWQVEDVEGRPHLRYLRAMMMEPGCDKCHAILGYELGDMRGATGVNLPLDSYYQQISESRLTLGVSHGIIWLFGLAGMTWSGRVARQRDLERAAGNARRTRVEEALARQVAFTESLIDAEIDGVSACQGIETSPHIRFSVWNRAMQELTGYSMEEVNRLGWYQTVYVDPEVRERARQRMERMRQGDHLQGEEWIITRKDGEPRTVLIYTKFVASHDGTTHVLAVMRDVSEQKFAREELERRERYQRAVLDNFPFLVWLKDTDSRFLAVNQPFADACGQPTPEAVAGTTDLDVWPKDLANRYRADDKEVLRSGEPRYVEEPLQLRERQIWVETYKSPITLNEKIIGTVGFARDITDRRQAETRLRLAASVFSHAREGIVITDEVGTIVETNETFSVITGYSREEAIGQNLRQLNLNQQSAHDHAAMWKALQDKGHWYGELWNLSRNRDEYAEMLTISAVHDAAGTTQNYVVLFTDITPMKKHQQQIERMAHFDALTSLPNRVLLADRLQQAMAQSQRRGRPLAVAYLDLDGFKPINDTHGHSVGDKLLISISSRMKEVLREGDTLARIGGDEFVAVLVDLEGPHDWTPVLNRLLQAAAEPVTVGALSLRVSGSIGFTLYPQDGADADQLIRHADQAMYLAKQAGKNRYHQFDIAQDVAVTSRHESLGRIRLALTQHEFVLHYQPKVNMRTGTVIGAEALIRWQHPEQGLLPPARFLPIIEGDPVSAELGEWVIDTALDQIGEWNAAGLEIPVSVNVGALQLQQDDFVPRLTRLLNTHPNVRSGQLQLEVLETSALEDVEQVSKIMRACRALGVSFSLDDFGTGYSSLVYLKRLPAELLKIDRSFVRDMLDDPDDLAIVEGVIGLANAFRLKVLAEGVEEVAQGTKLLLLGCELAQGYGIARPMPPKEMPDWVSNWRPDAAWAG